MVGKSSANQIYLDYNATTPLADEVIESITAALPVWGNPSSPYHEGKKAKKLVMEARKDVADCINAPSTDDIIFTSGGSESNNWVIQSTLASFKSDRSSSNQLPHVITSNVEHDSVIKPLKQLESSGQISLTLVDIDHESGELDLKQLSCAISANTFLVTVMWANNETGTIMPIKEIVKIVRQRESELGKKVLVHTDAAQVIGKMKVDVQDVAVDFLTIVGHKFYGPKIGALYATGETRDSGALRPVTMGGGQERGWRAGTENVPMIAGLGRACRLVGDKLTRYARQMETTRDHLVSELKRRLGEENLHFNCKSEKCLVNTCNVSILLDGCKGYKVLEKAEGFCCSTGSACHSHGCEPSQVLISFGVERGVAMNALRLSTGRHTSMEEVERVAEELARIVGKIAGSD